MSSPIAVIKYPDNSNPQKENFFLANSPSEQRNQDSRSLEQLAAPQSRNENNECVYCLAFFLVYTVKDPATVPPTVGRSSYIINVIKIILHRPTGAHFPGGPRLCPSDTNTLCPGHGAVATGHRSEVL